MLLPCIVQLLLFPFFFFFNDTATTEIYTLSLHDALPIYARIVEADPLGRERLRVERPAGPAHHVLVLLVLGIGDDREEVLVARRPAHIFGRTSAGTGNAARIARARLTRVRPLELEHVLPAVTEVAAVGSARALDHEGGSDADLPARERRALVLELVVRDADAERLVRGGLVQLELVQVAVLPAHGILNRDVKVPEGVVGRH